MRRFPRARRLVARALIAAAEALLNPADGPVVMPAPRVVRRPSGSLGMTPQAVEQLAPNGLTTRVVSPPEPPREEQPLSGSLAAQRAESRRRR